MTRFKGSRMAPAVLLATLALAACGASRGEEPGNGLRASESDSPVPSEAPQQVRPAPGSAWVIFGADTVVAELARTEAERSRGLMYRDAMAEDAGMLFVFPEASVRSFWMQNTHIPLDIAFMDPDFRILDIQQMEPMTLDSHTSRGPAMYALEVNKGWFEAHGVTVGAVPQVVFGS